jgi:hypothetical protein
MDCNQACATTHSAGWKLFQQVDALGKGACVNDCAYGGDWACVGHVSWPAPAADTTTTTVNVVGLYARNTTGNPLVPDAKISVCGPAPTLMNFGFGYDSSCSSPLVTSPAMPVTDPNGDATYSMPTTVGLGLGRSGLNGFSLIRTTGYADAYFYGGYPLSEPAVTIGPPFTPPPFVETRANAMPGTGEVWVAAFDCLDAPAAGAVEVVTNQGTKADFFFNGVGQFTNVPTGYIKLTATPPGLGKPSSQVAAWVYDGAVTIVGMPPTP